jgi:tetratricopeptide (TPR) repeat protein
MREFMRMTIMNKRKFISYFLMVACCLSNPCQADSQKLQAPLFNNLGSFHHSISTKVPLAQRLFDQGLVLFYGFEWGESIRSFKEAIRLDPDCAMCYWGLALALGDKGNAPMTGHENSNARTAIQKALALASHKPLNERIR